jgi:hypothetical protein
MGVPFKEESYSKTDKVIVQQLLVCKEMILLLNRSGSTSSCVLEAYTRLGGATATTPVGSN